MKTPKVYIIIPCYNAEQYLSRCLDSVFSNDYKDYQVICVNDGSKDNTLSLLNSYKDKHDNLLIIDEVNQGPAVARNTGLDSIKDKSGLVMFIDSDDWVDKDYITNMVSLLIENDVDIVSASHYFSSESSEGIKQNMPQNPVKLTNFEAVIKILEDKEITSFSHHKLFKLSTWDNVRYPVDGYFLEDTATIYKTFINASSVLLSNYAGYHYYQSNSTSVMRSKINNHFILTGWQALKSICDYSFTMFTLEEQSLIKKKANSLYMDNFLELYPRINKTEDKILIKQYYQFAKSIVNDYIPNNKNKRIKKKVFKITPCLYYRLFRIYLSVK